MRPESEFQAALDLVGKGLNGCEISRRLGIPRGTIRDWRHAAAKNPGHRTTHATGRRSSLLPVSSTNPGGPCLRVCDAPAFALRDRSACFYLLGQYLGDGSLAEAGRGVYRLRISMTWDYPGILVETVDAISVVGGRETVGIYELEGCSEVFSNWKHWVCVFPQHGAGRKHERRIVLEPWQLPRSSEDHRELIRGPIHSDGCRFINPVKRKLANGWKRYEYVRYAFTNVSADIRTIFTDSLDALDIEWRQMNARSISIARSRSVDALEEFVGPKH